MKEGALLYRFGRQLRTARKSLSAAAAATTMSVCVLCCEPMTDFVSRLVFVLQRLNITVQLLRFARKKKHWWCCHCICWRVLPDQLFVSAPVEAELNASVSSELQRHSRVLVVVDRRQHDWVMFACEQQPPPAGVVVVLDDSAQTMTVDQLRIGGDPT